MGRAIAYRLLDRGVQIAVWNRSSPAVESLRHAGAIVVDSPKQLSISAPCVISLLHDDDAARQVYLGPNGLLCEEGCDCLFLEMSTLRPDTSRFLHSRARAAGAAMLDVPVSGTVGPARKGQLTALVGGDREDLERARAILELIARTIIYAGPAGQGALLKLVVNLPLGVYWHALGEALSLGAAGGLDLRLMLDTLNDSAAALAVLEMKIPTILGETDEVTFDVAAMRKDMTTITQTAASLGTDATSAIAALSGYCTATNAGLHDADAVVIARPGAAARNRKG